MSTTRLYFVDSHTEGEPTRVIVSGLPDFTLGQPGISVAAQARVFRERFDHLRGAIVNEPRGSDCLVGAAIVPSSLPHAVCGVIFFNNVGLLHACGHGTIGLAVTLASLGRIRAGSHVVETPVGPVTIHLDEALAEGGSVRIDNVPSYLHARDVCVHIQWQGRTHEVVGDVAWGGNWFFLVHEHELELSLTHLDALTDFTWRIRQALERDGITGAHAGLIDHVELFAPPTRPDCDARNFVLCPGKAYDRSPCGTGTSAAMAARFARGELALGQPWRQESIIASRFVGSLRREGDQFIPSISGSAFVTASGTLVLHEHDPFRHGIPR